MRKHQQNKEEVKEHINELFCDRYKPASMKDLVINKKKIDEFKLFMDSPEKKLLIIQGPPGCGKNTLVETYCKDNNLEFLRYKDSKPLNYSEVMDNYDKRRDESDDFISLMNFLEENFKAVSNANTHGIEEKKKSAFRKFKRLSIHDTETKSKKQRALEKSKRARMMKKEKERKDGKILVINGIPECLKVYSIRKFSMLSDFNSKLSSILDSDKTNLVVFTFSDLRERNNSFLSKIFNDSNLKGEGVKIMKLNPISKRSITKILKNVVEDCGTQISKDQVEDIMERSAKDLRHALLTLQLFSAGKMGHENISCGYRRKRNNPTGEMTMRTQELDESSFFSNNGGNAFKTSMKKKKTKNVDENKDFGLLIFHALGKFLYNKRIDPTTQTEKIMTSRELMAKPPPKYYYKHQEVLDKVQTENHTFSLFLEQNMYDFFEDIEDMSKVLDVYSHNDCIGTVQDYSFANTKYYNEVEDLCALTESYAVTEFNLHGGDKPKGGLKKMSKPEWFNLRREFAANKDLINEITKLEQTRAGKIKSPDMLMASNSTMTQEYIPYISGLKLDSSFKDLIKLNEYRKYISENDAGEEDLLDEEKEKEFLNNLEKNTNRQRKMNRDKEGRKDNRMVLIHPQDNKMEVIGEEIEDSSDENDSLSINSEDLEGCLSDISSD